MLETITTKICNKCKVEKELDMFTNLKSSKDGKNLHCKECNHRASKEYRLKNKAKIRKIKQKKYQENKEKILVQRKEYYEKNREDVLQRVSNYTEENREEINEKRRESRKQNPEHFKEKDRKKYLKFRDEILKDRKRYFQENKKAIAEYKKAYYYTPKGNAISKNKEQMRRSIKKQGDVTTEQMMELHSNAKTCYWCNKSLKNKKVHIDHYEPLSKGGEHTLSNLVVSCSKCNLSKNAKDPIIFANTLGRLF